MGIYTGTGDRGTTGLLSGERVGKDDKRIEAYGIVDELNSILGGLVAALPEDRPEIAQTLRKIQADLFTMGAWMSAIPDSPVVKQLNAIQDARVAALEGSIDALQESLPVLTCFIIPGGHLTSAWAHIARTVCRRAERHAVRVFRDDYTEQVSGTPQTILRYLNRLSDYLFTLARYCNMIHGVQDVEWHGESG